MEDQKVSITLSYNTDYTLDVMAVNCAGHSEVSRVSDIFLGIHVYNRSSFIPFQNIFYDNVLIKFNLQLTAQFLLPPMLGWQLSPTTTLLKGLLFTSTVAVAFIPMNEGWLFVNVMVNGVLKFQVRHSGTWGEGEYIMLNACWANLTMQAKGTELLIISVPSLVNQVICFQVYSVSYICMT